MVYLLPGRNDHRPLSLSLTLWASISVDCAKVQAQQNGQRRRRQNPFWEGDLWDCANVKSSCAPLLFSQAREERWRGEGELRLKELPAACAAAGKTKLHVDFIVNCIKRLHIKNFIYHLGC